MDEWPERGDDFDEPQEPERPRDPAIDRAKEAILNLLQERKREVFYGRQVEVLLEKDFFHWITDFALAELIEERQIAREKVELARGSAVRVQFVFHRSHRFRKRQMSRALEVVRDLSRIAGACGQYAEVLFKLAFLKRRFGLVGEDTSEYGGKVWEETGHKLDFIIDRDGEAYGVEVKNRLGYIERAELETKVRICRFLGLRPMFVMRAAAKSYNYYVIQQGGFALLFGSQIYPPGQEQLVVRMNGVLGLPAVCTKAISEGIIDRFVRWHEKGVRGR